MPLHVLYSFPTRLGVPGIGTTAWHQVQGLADLGVRVTLFCGSLERPLRGVERIVETMKLGPIPLSYQAMGLDRGMAWHDRRVAKALRRIADDVDVVHCWPLGALHTLTAARDLDINSLLERPNAHTAFAYEIVAREHARIGLPVPKGHTHAFNHGRLEREEREYQASTRLACPSEFVARSFLEQGFEPDRIVRHQYGFDPKLFFSDAAATDPGRPFTAAFIGRCEPRKGLHYALQAWHESGASALGRFLIAGTFIDGYEKLLGKWLDHPSVIRLGFTQDIASVMRQSDVLMLPSVEEGSALVTYEAQACGMVPVVSDAAGAFCTHMRDGLVHAAGDLATLRDHVNLLATKPQVLAQLRQGVLSHLPELTWSAAARKLVEIYTEASANAPLPLENRSHHGSVCRVFPSSAISKE